MKSSSALLIIGEVLIDTPMRCPLTAVRVAVITVYKQEMLERPWRKGSLLSHCWECELGNGHYGDQYGGSFKI